MAMRIKMHSKEGVQGAGRFTHNRLMQGQHMFCKTVRTSLVICVVSACC